MEEIAATLGLASRFGLGPGGERPDDPENSTAWACYAGGDYFFGLAPPAGFSFANGAAAGAAFGFSALGFLGSRLVLF